MDFAVVIDAGNDAAALKQAIDTELLLLDRLGSRLESIRLAVPRLLHHACASAIAEKPDILVLVGGPRAARSAGQLAYEHGVPILFLPGERSPGWAVPLWGSLSLEDLVAALTRNDPQPTRLSAGAVGGQLFFGDARCGLLPHVAELRQALRQADTYAETWQALSRAASLARLAVRPRIRVRPDAAPPRCATTLLVSVQRAASTESGGEGTPLFACEAQSHGFLQHWGALSRAALGGDWQYGADLKRFACSRLAINVRPNWLLLDGDPKRVKAPIEITMLRDAIQTFTLTRARGVANDNLRARRTRAQSLTTLAETRWNLPARFHVRPSENGNGFDLGQTK